MDMDSLVDKLFQIKELLEKADPKIDFKGPKPTKQGSMANEAHQVTHINGQRKISSSFEDKSTGERRFGNRKVDNKVKTTHLWNHETKEWKHHKTEHVLGGLNVDGSPKHQKTQNVKTPTSVAHDKAAAHEKAKSEKKPEVKQKPKTIRRKLSKSDLVKALSDAGYRQSALLLKNWDTYDDRANELLEKEREL